MKKIMIVLFAVSFMFLISGTVKSQAIEKLVDTYELINDTCANSTVKYGYLSLDKPGFKTDSVLFVGVYEGEINADLFVLSRGWKVPGETALYITEASADSTTITPDNAAATDTYEGVIYAMTSSICRGVNYVKVRVETAASGNDADDPNAVMIYAIVYRSRVSY